MTTPSAPPMAATVLLAISVGSATDGWRLPRGTTTFSRHRVFDPP